MKKMNHMLLIAALSISAYAHSAHATVKLGPITTTDIKDVKLSESVVMDDGKTTVKRVTQGLRQKKIVFAWFSVYVAQVFSNEPKPDFASIAKLRQSVLAGSPLVVSMTFVREVDIGKISEGFKEALEENKLDVEAAPYSEFLSSIKKAGDVKDRQNFFFVFTHANGKASLSVQTDKTKSEEIFSLKDQSPEVVDSFLKLWMANPADSGVEQLQDQFLKQKD